jgi:glycerol kinase
MIVWDRKTGKPARNAIVWEDRRTAPICKQLREEGFEEPIRQKTGLVIDAYFSASKRPAVSFIARGGRYRRDVSSGEP